MTTEGTPTDRVLQQACDVVLERTVKSGIPGVVAMVTDRERTLYEGVRGVRDLLHDESDHRDLLPAARRGGPARPRRPPFVDPASVGGYLELETAVYDNLSPVVWAGSPRRRG